MQCGTTYVIGQNCDKMPRINYLYTGSSVACDTKIINKSGVWNG